MCESRTTRNLFASTVELHGSKKASNKAHSESASNSNGLVDVGANVLRIVWHNLYEKYDYLRRRGNSLKVIVQRESNNPLAKKFRRSLRLNKSAKKKGYEYFLSDEDKRRLDEYTRRHTELSARLGVPYDGRPAFG
uniref:Uncharacterized protein n=1 Tax=Ceratitis capitata TaxID=7213 RepID=W8BHV2_CERCA